MHHGRFGATHYAVRVFDKRRNRCFLEDLVYDTDRLAEARQRAREAAELYGGAAVLHVLVDTNGEPRMMTMLYEYGAELSR